MLLKLFEEYYASLSVWIPNEAFSMMAKCLVELASAENSAINIPNMVKASCNMHSKFTRIPYTSNQKY